ncbi:MAG: hypothetical protein F6K31_28670 [Symploca sp. SIO2G7]|nr:hypothetical protein [Symploca sp. SIO2G7]
MSFVICHLSFVICHLSFVICHLLSEHKRSQYCLAYMDNSQFPIPHSPIPQFPILNS